MFVGTIAGIYHNRIHIVDKVNVRTGHGVTHNNTINLHGFDILCRILKTFTFFKTATTGREINRVRRESLLCQFEGDSSPGGIFEEEVNNGLSLKCGHFLDGAIKHLSERRSVL